MWEGLQELQSQVPLLGDTVVTRDTLLGKQLSASTDLDSWQMVCPWLSRYNMFKHPLFTVFRCYPQLQLVQDVFHPQ